ncbi:uncharacterized protein LOC143568474 [Bidens hawaiensis]|uniref:uncharacterized protein LOC143568474 n=1 Tax=Bidens hawaiensis TaxID=980011 RepID=UPI004049F4EF
MHHRLFMYACATCKSSQQFKETSTTKKHTVFKMKMFNCMIIMMMITMAGLFLENAHAQGNNNNGGINGSTIGGIIDGIIGGSNGGNSGGNNGANNNGNNDGANNGGDNGGNTGGGSTCINQLAPCLSYLNNQQQGRDPPDSCCDPLKSMIKSNPECLCSMITNQGTKNAERAGINVTQAQELPARCGQRVNPISCLTSTSNKNTPGTSDSQQMRCSKIYPFMMFAALYYWFM